MADWQLLLLGSVVIFILAARSFGIHLQTPADKRTEGINQPFIFISLVAIPILILSYVLYLLSK